MILCRIFMANKINSSATIAPRGMGRRRLSSTEEVDARRSGTIYSCTSYLANTIVGSGMLGLPHALSESGYLVGILFVLLFAWFSSVGLHLLSIVAHQSEGMSSFYSVANQALPGFSPLIDFIVALKCFGVATSHLIVIGDTMSSTMDFLLNTGVHNELVWLTNKQLWITIFLVFLITPLSCFKQLNALQFTSSVSIVFVFCITIIIFMYSLGLSFMNPCLDFEPLPDRDHMVCKGIMEPYTDFTRTIQVLTIFIFSFTCQQNIFSVVNEIKSHSQRRVDMVIKLAISFAVIVYLVISLSGYYTFGSEVLDNILLNFPKNHLLTFSRIFVVFLVIFSYPLQLHPSRKCILSLISSFFTIASRYNNQQYRKESKNGNLSLDVETPVSPLYISLIENDIEEEIILDEYTASPWLFYGITAIFLFLSFNVAITVDSLGTILALVGATGSTMVSYILPGLIYIRSFPHFHFKIVLAWIQFLMGCIIAPTALYFVIAHMK
jgi:amino acid permease